MVYNIFEGVGPYRLRVSLGGDVLFFQNIRSAQPYLLDIKKETGTQRQGR
jgi:hypothetical protein